MNEEAKPKAAVRENVHIFEEVLFFKLRRAKNRRKTNN